MIPELNETMPPASEASLGNLENGPPRKPIQSVPLTDLEKQKLADLNWAAASPEVQEHSGKFVVIHKKKIVAVGDDYGKLLEQAAEQEQCPTGHLVVEVVPNWLEDHFWCELDVPKNHDQAQQIDEFAGEAALESTSAQRVSTELATELQRQKLADLDWAATSPEVQKHSGKFVIVHKKRIIAIGDDRTSLVQEAAKKENCPWWHLVVEIVPSWDEWTEIPRSHACQL